MTQTLMKTKEPILEESNTRFTLFPIKYHSLFELYVEHANLIWLANEIQLHEDVQKFQTLPENVKHFLTRVLAFFAASDGIVNENLAIKFYNEVQIPEARAFYSIQMAIETVHSHVYSLLIDTYVQEPLEKDRLFRAIETIPSIQSKATWALNWLSSDRSFAERLLAFVAVEGIMFQSSFAAIYWLKGKQDWELPGLIQANNFIARDENLHALFGCKLYNELENKLPVETVHELFLQAYEVEKEFVLDALPVSMIGMNSELMLQHLQVMTNFWLVRHLNLPALFPKAPSESPFEFMKTMALPEAANFFERKDVNYNRIGAIHQEEINLSDFDL